MHIYWTLLIFASKIIIVSKIGRASSRNLLHKTGIPFPPKSKSNFSTLFKFNSSSTSLKEGQSLKSSAKKQIQLSIKASG